MSQFNAFRDGKVHVRARQCKTCIYRSDSPLNADGTKGRLQAAAVEADTAIICHSTLGVALQAVCRGFYDNSTTITLRLAAALGRLEFDR